MGFRARSQTKRSTRRGKRRGGTIVDIQPVLDAFGRLPTPPDDFMAYPLDSTSSPNPADIRQQFIQAGFNVDTIIDSTGEHLTKYGGKGGWFAACGEEDPSRQCNPRRMGWLVDREHAAEGFSSSSNLIAFVTGNFPSHISQNHSTRIVAPLSPILP